MGRARPILAAAVAASMTLVLTGCVADVFGGADFSSTSAMTSAAMDAIKTIELPKGYAITNEAGGESGIDYSNANHYFTAEKTGSTEKVADVCKEVIAYGESIGATSWYTDPNYVPFPITDHESEAQVACVLNKEVAWLPDGTIDPNASTSTFGLWGVNFDLVPDQKIPVTVEFLIGATSKTPKPQFTMTVSTAMANDDPRFAERTWDEAFAQLVPDMQAYYSAIGAIGAYRAAHPKDGPMAEKPLKAAIVGFGVTWPSVTATIVPAGKRGYFLQLVPVTKDYLVPLCVALEPFDPTYFGTEDPGGGYTLGYLWNDTVPRSEFGSAIETECPAAPR